ncbi:unnamed protein product [Orchesella dallaii]|uniref:F-box domain-containing protein n=1 Tax=Orchesella dallaii TaxID=48710 RepID=A0ABP1QKW8_9HEXA
MTTVPAVPDNSTSRTGWYNLSPQLKKTVLSNLKGNENEFLEYRLVNSTWKSMVDNILEQKRISAWTRWDPNINKESNFDTIPAIELRPTWTLIEETENEQANSYTGLEWQYPLLSAHNRKLGTPFPSNAVKISFSDTRYPNDTDMTGRVSVFLQFVGSYSHAFRYVSSILLTNIKLQVATFTTILDHLENLEVLSLDDIRVHSDENHTEENFPQLPRLKHLKVNTGMQSVSRALLQNYGKQLESLEMNAPLPCFETTRYENLQQLKLAPSSRIEPNELLPCLQGVNLFPMLKRFSVCHHEYMFTHEELLKWIDGFPQSLQHLQMDVIVNEDIERKDDAESTKSITENVVTFPLVHTLGIYYPKNYNANIRAVRDDIMPKFPNMQTLHLISAHQLWDDFDVSQVKMKDKGTDEDFPYTYGETSRAVKEKLRNAVLRKSNVIKETEKVIEQVTYDSDWETVEETDDDDSDWETVKETDDDDEEMVSGCKDIPKFITKVENNILKWDRPPNYNFSEELREGFRQKALLIRDSFLTDKCPHLRKITI